MHSGSTSDWTQSSAGSLSIAALRRPTCHVEGKRGSGLWLPSALAGHPLGSPWLEFRGRRHVAEWPHLEAVRSVSTLVDCSLVQSLETEP